MAAPAQALREEIASVTGLEANSLADDAPFASFGLESLQAVTIAANLSKKFGREISPTLFFDYPNIKALGAFLQYGAPGRAPLPLSGPHGEEKIAVVGLACRLPGANSPEAFWENLQRGVDSISEATRWDWKAFPELPAMRWGGFLTDIHSFDHELFGIPAPEAARMDPQQRILLECVAEALESARLLPSDLETSRTGVFVGISSSDFSVGRARESRAASVFDATGNAHSIAANRISYLYNLKGPSLSLDTACSSSLVAVHEAVKSLQSGECDVAIVGGVNVILEPELTRAFAEAGMLAPDGRCKTFSSQANGYVRGEGAGVVVLQRLPEADPARVQAVIRGSAVNHDGKTNGLTAPSGPAQEEVIRTALGRASMAPAAIDFVEAHGTGTALGDPVEFLSLARVFGGREGNALVVGSAKAFVGHLEAAAGIAGLIKTVLSLRHRAVPRQLHFQTINPKMKSASAELLIAEATRSFEGNETLRAGVSSFGFGGTNAHLILESAPLRALVPLDVKKPTWLYLGFSATDEAALRATGARWEKGLEQAPVSAFASSLGERLLLPRRLLVWGKDAPAVREALRKWQANEPGNWLERMARRGTPRNLAFAFTGQGSQYPRMGEELLPEREYREVWIELLAQLDAYFPESLEAVWKAETPEHEARLYQTDYGQALIFALEVSLATFWEKHWGLQPELVLGHSLGEISAATFAGSLSRQDACRLVAARGRLMQCTAEGAMISLRGKRVAVEDLLREIPGLELAAVNNQELFTLAGPPEAVQTALALAAARGLAGRALKVTRAFHSALMDPILATFQKEIEGIRFETPRFPLISGLTGERVPELNVAHWVRQLRETTQFLPAVQYALKQGIQQFLEIGPQGHLSAMGFDPVSWLPSLERGNPAAWPRKAAELLASGALCIRPKSGPESLPATAFGHRQIPPEVSMTATSSLLEEIRALVAGLLHRPAEDLDPDASLVDLGADSLLLLNAIQTIKERYGVSIAVADVFRSLNTLRAIAAFVEERRPREAAPAPPLPSPSRIQQQAARIAATNREAAQSDLGSLDVQSIIRHQLELMNQQLLLLAGGSPSLAPAAPAAPAPLSAMAAQASSGVAPPPAAVPSGKGVLGNWKANASREVNEEEKNRAQYVADLIQRFNNRTPKTKAHTQRYREYLADNRVSAGFRPNLKEMIYTIVFHEGQGSHFRDIDGNDYVDFTMGFGVNLFGHGPDFIEKRIRAQLDAGFCVGPQAELAGIVAEKACRVLNQERVAFLNSGTEAVMTALRLARAVTGRNRVVLFEGSYHGHADVVLARATGEGRSLPVAPGVPSGLVSDVTVLAYGEESALEYLRQHASELAAVLVEPVQSRYPEHQPVAFLQEIRKITEKSGTAFIFDEVICGLRVAPGGAQEAFGIRPDLAAYGKILGGGMPIGAVAGKKKFLDPIDGGFWKFGDDSYPQAEMTFFAGTFCKHPVTLAAADAVLDRFLEEGKSLTENLTARTAKLCARLQEILNPYGIEVPHFGSLFRFKSAGNLDLFFANMNLRGMYIWEGRNLFLSTAHSEEDELRFLEAARASAEDLEREGFFRKKL